MGKLGLFSFVFFFFVCLAGWLKDMGYGLGWDRDMDLRGGVYLVGTFHIVYFA